MTKILYITLDSRMGLYHLNSLPQPLFTEEEPQNETEEEPKEQEGVWSKIQEMDYYDGNEWD